MGQISIPIANKVGHSMFWSSMWDNKINFSRSFKEDVYLDKFIYLLFNDSLSSNIVFITNKKIDRIIKNKYSIHFRKEKNYSFKRYILKKNSFECYTSKIWILKYQNWILIYFFMYLPCFNTLKKVIIKSNKKKVLLRSFFSLYSNYLKSNEKIKLSSSIFNKNSKHYF